MFARRAGWDLTPTEAARRLADRRARGLEVLDLSESNPTRCGLAPAGALAGQRIGVETAKGAMATAGVDVALGERWFARADARYLQGGSDFRINGVDAGEAKLDPVIVGVGIGARF